MSRNKSQRPDAPAKPSTTNHVITAEYSGPIPPAAELAKYEMVMPGFAERIMHMAEKNQQHDHEIRCRALSAQRYEVHVGQICAVLITGMALGATVWMASFGAIVPASIVGGTTVCTLGLAFIRGRNSGKSK